VSGQTSAYEYDAFGNTLRATGTYAAANPFRFSTKYTDTETGLVYYGLRYYSPSLGRWINKDPLGEKGGLNLYAFGSNNSINGYDYLGNSWFSKYIIEPIQRLLGKVDNVIAKNHINVDGSVGGSYWIPITPANPNGQLPGTTGQNPFTLTSGTNSSGTGTTTGGTVIVVSPGSNPRGSTTSTGTGTDTTVVGPSVVTLPGDSNVQPTAPNSTAVPNANDTLLGRANLGIAQNGGAFAEKLLQTAANFPFKVLSAPGEILNAAVPQDTQQQLTALVPQLSALRIPSALEAFTGARQFISPANASPQSRLYLTRLLDLVDDGTVFGRLPDPSTASAPELPPAITLTIDTKPVAGAGPVRK
jgi:RHS repeat-associated protein